MMNNKAKGLTMKIIGLAWACGAVFMAFLSPVMAGGMMVTDARVRSVNVQHNHTTGAFMVIANHTGKNDILLSAKTPMADRTEIHKTTITNGMAKMENQAGGIPIGSGKKLVLKHGSYHVMMMGVKSNITVGQSVPITLVFKNAGAVKINATGFKINHQKHHHKSHQHK